MAAGSQQSTIKQINEVREKAMQTFYIDEKDAFW
jgi:hypothetical protein